MPGLVLKRIIKNIGLSLNLLPGFICHAKPAPRNPHQRKMEPQFLICWPIVFHDMWFSCESTEESMMIFVRNVLVDKLHRFGNLFAVGIEFHIVEFQIKNIPSSRIYRLAPNSIFWLDLWNPWWSPVWLESLLGSQGNQLISNHFIVFFEMLHPRKLRRIP